MFGCSRPENVIFTANDTYALNLAIKGIARRGGRYLISFDRAQLGAAPRCVACGARMQLRDISRLHRGIGSIGRAVGTAFARGYRRMLPQLNICGITQPLGAIGSVCRSRAARFISRCSAVGGAYPHRHGARRYRYPLLIRAQGVRHRLRLSYRLARSRFDGASTAYRGRQRYCLCRAEHAESLPERLEAGTLCLPAIASLEAGIRFVREIGEEAIETHICGLGRRVRDMLLSLPGVRVYMPERVSGVVLFNVMGRGSEEVAAELDARGICVRAGLHCSPLAHKMLGTPEGGAVRASFGIYNTAEQTDRFTGQ